MALARYKNKTGRELLSKNEVIISVSEFSFSIRGSFMIIRPLVFIHKGNQKYLKKVINLAEKNNKNVYLIGDKTNKYYCQHWIDFQELNQLEYLKFKKTYIHLSTNRYEFELGCFERYFLLYEFMKKHDVSECFMVDSDVCVFTDLEKEILDKYDVALSATENGIPNIWCMSPHCSYWKKEALAGFLEYLEHLYKNHDKRLERLWDFYKKNKMYGGISDMVILHLWVKEKRIVWKNLAMINDDKVFDDNVSSLCNYKGQLYQERKILGNRRIKKICYRNRLPYFLNFQNEMIATRIIHAQGENKMYISVFTSCRNSAVFYLLAVAYHDITVWIYSVIQKVLLNKRNRR